MENPSYHPRICDDYLKRKLRSSGAVLIIGPKWCGKTWTGLNVARSVIFLQDPDKRSSYIRLAQTEPSYLLQGEKPRLIDEWQIAPVLWDAVRFAIDLDGKKGQFILTGSVVVPGNDSLAEYERREHSGTGRISRLRMRTMSLFESGESTGLVSLKSLFDGKEDIVGEGKLSITDTAFAICRGGWPSAVDMEREDALEVAYNYVDAVCEEEISIEGSRKNPERMRSILRSLSRNVSTMTSDRTIISDVVANDISLTNKTLENYIKVLRDLFLIEDIKAWQPSIRSKTGIRTSDKRQFTDPSLAVASLGLSPEALLDDFNYFGFLFESLVVRDLRIYSEPLRGTIKHYHDNSGLESDIIISLDDGRWAAVEVKLGTKEIDMGAENLKKLSSKINTEKHSSPSFLMVVTGGKFAYRREDGVLVVPISALKD
ncbi:MAG: ATP-binding protein [Paramuribaculum sp.]|nr:ATP-binding protein [Paramuribaculum sp.]